MFLHAPILPKNRPLCQEEIKQALSAAIGKDSDLIIFPEGTRSQDGILAPFKSGLYYLCRAHPHIEAVPVKLENLNRILPKGEFLAVPLLGAAWFGEPIKIAEKESKHEFLTRARAAMETL